MVWEVDIFKVEVEKEIKVIQVTMPCPRCNKGTMEASDGCVWTTYPSPHMCTECGHEEYYGTQYPYVKYKELWT